MTIISWTSRSRTFKRAAILSAGLAMALTTSPPALRAVGEPDAPKPVTFRPPADERSVSHLLNRIGFGPRQGDVARVRAMGVTAYVDQQLHPDRISDATVDGVLASFTTLTKSPRQIAEEYDLPAQAARRALQQQRAAEGGAAPSRPGQPPRRNPSMQAPSDSSMTDPNAVTPRRRAPQASASQPQGPPGMNPDSAPEPIRRERQVMLELGQQKVYRAVYSDRQLQEVLVDFWFNHFNVFAGKGPDRLYMSEYERDVIRPHVLGKFRDMLGAVAESPAMLFYLDNWQSADPNGPDPQMALRMQQRQQMGGFGGRPNRGGQRPRAPFGQPRPNASAQAQPGQQNRQNRTWGINENYGRELMELHTLGVDSGYTQQDIIEVARAFTGWTIANPRRGGSFTFLSEIHDAKPKTVLGRTINAGGKKDGEMVLDLLARHPATATFIATKLARRLVGDTPPPALIQRAAARFTQTDGDLREVVRTIVLSPEMFAPTAYRAKVKTPFEFVVSAIRASNARVDDATVLVRTLNELGMPLYMCQPPTGYKDVAEAWVNTGTLLSRMNFAISLANNRLRGVTVDLGAAPGAATDAQLASMRTRMVHDILSGEASANTVETIAKASAVTQMAALAIGAPEFQRR